MSNTIRPNDFVKVYLKENKEAGARGSQVDLLLTEMHATTEASLKQAMAPSPMKEVLDAGAKGTQVQVVLDEMEKATKAAIASGPLASPLKKLNIIS